MPASKCRPNIVFIVLDTHRVDRLSCYGYPRDTSPNLDAFAQEATLFENAIAPAQWTIPSHASMFSGEPPSTHMTVQSGDILDSRFKTLAQHLQANGYRTAGFCNNPLVGVISNGLRRGFDTFYNYGGAIPSKPARPAKRVLTPLSRIWELYTQLLRKISYPIQNAFANSGRLFQAALNPFWVPLWTRVANFKGDTPGSIRDATHFVEQQMNGRNRRPHLLFINLMETHLPYTAPEGFVKKLAPYFWQDRAARNFMHVFNTQALHWITPMARPFTDLQSQAISDMYDAEVAYQDHLLGELFAALNQEQHRHNTMVIVVADHGEMLGEHQLMGHGFGVYQELIHVPLLIRFPGQMDGRRIAAPVSTTRLFHTVLDAAGIEVYETHYSPTMDVRSKSLIREAKNPGQAQPAVFCEAYAPEFTLKIMRAHKADLIEPFNCQATHWATYQSRDKLIRVEDVRDELFDLDADPLEMRNLQGETAQIRKQQLIARLEAFLENAKSHQPENWERKKANLDNEILQQRLRNLGYIE